MKKYFYVIIRKCWARNIKNSATSNTDEIKKLNLKNIFIRCMYYVTIR